MKWSSLFEKLGKQKLKVTQHNDVTIRFEDKEYPLKLKFDTYNRTKPYFVIDDDKDYFIEFDERINIYE